MQAHKLEVWLVGRGPEHYCAGYAKGAAKTCQVANGKYADGTVWALPKVTFDNYAAATYIASPIPFRMDLAKATLQHLDGQFGAGMP